MYQAILTSNTNILEARHYSRQIGFYEIPDTLLTGDTKLSTNGIRQSRLVGQALAPIQFTRVYCSPQTRAVQVFLSTGVLMNRLTKKL
jgi:broad specificity phosphatase PhoE